MLFDEVRDMAKQQSVKAENEWQVVDVVEVRVRRGTKDPWLELVIVKKDGKGATKLIARKVDRFWSEKSDNTAPPL